MASKKETVNKTLSSIDAALTIVNKFPSLKSGNIDADINISGFLMECFKRTAGYNFIINLLSKYIAFVLPAVEMTIKGAILAQLKNFISCSINPFITEEIIRDGVTLDMRNVDMTGILGTNPLDQSVGKYFYFGCEGFRYPDEVIDSEDMDCLLWYMKNRAKYKERHAWGKNPKDKPSEDKKQTKKDGVCTFEFSERAGQVTDAYGQTMEQQTPYNNCLHVYIGNTCQIDVQERVAAINNLKAEKQNVQDRMDKINEDQSKIDELTADLSKQEDDFTTKKIDKAKYDANVNNDQTQIDALNAEILNLQQQNAASAGVQAGLEQTIAESYRNGTYRTDPKLNYYYHRPLFEWNFDYVNSLKLFDSKVVAAQLIDALTGCLSFHLHPSRKQMEVKQQIQRMVESIVNDDSAVVSDCFFSFDNSQYAEAERSTERIKQKQFVASDGTTQGVRLKPDELLSRLDSIQATSSQAEVQDTIGNALDYAGTLSSNSSTQSDQSGQLSINAGFKANFIENLLNALMNVITSAVLSPKFFVLILVNSKIAGMATNFSLADFIAMYKQMITGILRTVRDSLLDFLKKELLKIIGNLAAGVALKVVIEQAQYLVELLRKIFACFRKRRKGKGDEDIDDWTPDDVSADIDNTDSPKNAGC